MDLSRRQVLAAGLGLPLLATSPASGGRPASDLAWAGRQWTRRDWPGEPGPNTWSSSGPYVARDGSMRLRILKSRKKWTCSEVLTAPLGFGTYEWTVRGPVHALDRNVVLGLFVYADDGREVDVELARWGSSTDPTNAQWAVQPWHAPGNLARFGVPAATSVRLRFAWTQGSAVFSGEAATPDGTVVLPGFENAAAPTSPDGVKLHMNLWLFEGRPPTDGQPVEVALTGFRFTPAG